MKKETTISVEIPPGVSTGNYIPLRGEGNAGQNGGAAGDLVVIVEETRDKAFERRGDDLFVQVFIPFTTAALGGKVEIPVLKGKASLKIPPGTQSGRVFSLKGKGVPRLGGYGRGNQLVEVRVWTPTRLSREEKKLLEELDKISGTPPPSSR